MPPGLELVSASVPSAATLGVEWATGWGGGSVWGTPGYHAREIRGEWTQHCTSGELMFAN